MNNIVAIRAFKDNYIWAVHSLHGQQIVVIDPGDAEPVLDYLQANELLLKAILITHHHADHTGGILTLKAHFPKVTVYGPKLENIAGVEHLLTEGDIIFFEDFELTLKILDIPGHTKGHIAYFNDDIVFCGDTLFSCGCGRIFEGTPEQMWQSLEKLKRLSKGTRIYCGHEYTKANIQFAKMVDPTNQNLEKRLLEVQNCLNESRPSLPVSLERECETNPFLRVNTKEIISSVQKHWKLQKNDAVSIFSHLREWKNQS